MASSLAMVEFICDQIQSEWNVRAKKMFGDYLVYVNDKPIFLICDDSLFVKICDETKDFFGKDTEIGFPYDGARQHYVVDFVDDKEKMLSLARLLLPITPLPKKKSVRK